MSLLTASKKKARGRFGASGGGAGTSGLPPGFLLPSGWEVAASYDTATRRVSGNPYVTEGTRLTTARAIASNTTPANGAALETALTSLTGNQKVTLTNAATYTCTNTVSLTAGANTANWRYIGPTDPSFLPASALTRVNATHRASMPKLSFAPANASDGSHPAMWLVADGCKKLLVEGIDFRANHLAGMLGYFVYMGDTSGHSASYGVMPDEIVFRHCWFDGVGTFAVLNGLALNGNRVVVEGCYIENISSNNPGGTSQDGAAITGWNGQWNRVTNNYLEGEYMCLFMQGLGAATAAQVPQDWLIEKNELAKRASWYARGTVIIKNNFEMKGGVRFVIQDNDINGSAGTGQDASLVVLKMVRQGGPNADSSWWETGHLYFGNNVLRNGKNGFQISGDPELTGGIGLHDICIERNRLTLLGGRDEHQTDSFGQGIRYENVRDMTFRWNTVCAGFAVCISGVRGANMGGCSITDNVIACPAYDYNGGTFRNVDGGNAGDPAFGLFLWEEFKTVYPAGDLGLTYARNAVLCSPISNGHAYSNPYHAVTNPTGNRLVDNYTGVAADPPAPSGHFVDVGAPGALAYQHDNWTLQSGSSFKGVAEGGADPGCNNAALDAITTNAVAGSW